MKPKPFAGALILATIALVVGYLWLTNIPIQDDQPVTIDRVQLAMPDTYFPTEIRVGFKNYTGDSLHTVRFLAEYRSPNARRTYWTRTVVCEDLFLGPKDRWQGKCFFEGSTPRKRYYPNAAVFLETLSTR